MIPSPISCDDNVALLAPVTKQAIECVVKTMPVDKAPNPDGLLAEFYRRYSNVVALGVTDAMEYLFYSARFPNDWKATFISLISKVSAP